MQTHLTILTPVSIIVILLISLVFTLGFYADVSNGIRQSIVTPDFLKAYIVSILAFTVLGLFFISNKYKESKYFDVNVESRIVATRTKSKTKPNMFEDTEGHEMNSLKNSTVTLKEKYDIGDTIKVKIIEPKRTIFSKDSPEDYMNARAYMLLKDNTLYELNPHEIKSNGIDEIILELYGIE